MCVNLSCSHRLGNCLNGSFFLIHKTNEVKESYSSRWYTQENLCYPIFFYVDVHFISISHIKVFIDQQCTQLTFVPLSIRKFVKVSKSVILTIFKEG